MPKVLEIEQSSPLSPDDLEAALREDTRFSLFPYQGSPFVGNVRLKGRVKKGKVKVGLTKRDWWTFLQPVFQGEIEATESGGSRLVGQAGIPPWLVWYMRIATAVFVPLAVIVAGGPVISEAGPKGVAIAAAFCLVAVLGTIMGVGLNLSHAEKQLPDLEATLADISGSGVTLADPQPTTTATSAASSTSEGNSRKGRQASPSRSAD